MEYELFDPTKQYSQMDLVNMVMQMENHNHNLPEFSQLRPPPPPPPPPPPSVIDFSAGGYTNNSTTSFGGNYNTTAVGDLDKPPPTTAAMREMIFQIAAMQPVYIDPEAVKAPKRRNVRISKDPQSVAARHRRERISERIRILQRLVPGGTKMDTASMLDEAIHYVKFLKTQVQSLERVAANRTESVPGQAHRQNYWFYDQQQQQQFMNF